MVLQYLSSKFMCTLNLKQTKLHLKMTDLETVKKTAFFGHFSAFLDGKKQTVISGPHFKSLN